MTHICLSAVYRICDLLKVVQCTVSYIIYILILLFMSVLSPVRCVNPVIINNPVFRTTFHRIRCYKHSPLFDYSYVRFHDYKSCSKQFAYIRKSRGVSLSDYEQYTVVYSDGEIVPMYIVVPCTRCVLCRGRKVKEWQFRTVVQMNFTSLPSYLITLTFNNSNIPSRGVSVRSIQLFMKRLRISLYRYGFKDLSKLSYLACGEYGKTTKRPHFHILLHGFPQDNAIFPNLAFILKFIESCWSYGFCYVKPCDSGASNYVTKYLLKSSYNLDIGPYSNPPFLCSSKHYGLSYLTSDVLEFIYSNPPLKFLSVTDNLSGRIFKTSLSGYYSRYIYQSSGSFLSYELVKLIDRCVFLVSKILSILEYLTFINFDIPKVLFKFVSFYYGDDYEFLSNEKYSQKISEYSEDRLLSCYDTFCCLLNDALNLLSFYDSSINLDSYSHIRKYLHKRKSSLSVMPRRFYDIESLIGEEIALKNKLLKDSYREVF